VKLASGDPVRNVGTPDRSQRQQVVKGQARVGGSYQHQGHDDHAGLGAPNHREYLVVVDVLERPRQCEYGRRSDSQADRHAEALQSGAAAGSPLQHDGLQGVHPCKTQYR